MDKEFAPISSPMDNRKLPSSKRKSKLLGVVGAFAIAAGLLSGCSTSSQSNGQLEKVTDLTIYSGRSEEYIAPFLAQFEKESGIKLNIRYGNSPELAAQILEEGENSPADLFISQDAGSLGAVKQAGLFKELPPNVANEIPNQFIEPMRHWVGITGRVRVFAYSPSKLKKLPKEITDLSDPIYKGQLGIAPSNASFQAFLTALINLKGESFAEKWLRDLVANDVKIYPKNSSIVEAIDRGEISVGLVNHYYLWEVAESLGREVNAKIEFFQAGDIGNLINVSGAGVFKSSKKQSAAEDLINFLTSKPIQDKYVSEIHEYSLLANSTPPAGLPRLSDIGAPSVDLNSLKNIQAAQDLLTKVGLL